MKYQELKMLYDATMNDMKIPMILQNEFLKETENLIKEKLLENEKLTKKGEKVANKILNLVKSGDWGKGVPFDKRGIPAEPSRIKDIGVWISGSYKKEEYKTNNFFWIARNKWNFQINSKMGSPKKRKHISKTLPLLANQFKKKKIELFITNWMITPTFDDLCELKTKDDMKSVYVPCPYIDFILSCFKSPKFYASEQSDALIGVWIRNRKTLNGIVAFISTIFD